MNVITETKLDRSRSLLIGTNGGLNIVRLDEEGKEEFRFKNYDNEEGLIGDIIHGILEDDNGIIWLSTNKGLSKFDPAEEKFTNYDKSDGLLDKDFSPRLYLKSRNGEFFFGNPNGLISFYPDSIKDNVNIPNIVITDFQVFNKSVKIIANPDGSFLTSVKLREGINTIAIKAINKLGKETEKIRTIIFRPERDFVVEETEEVWETTQSN